MSDYTLTGLEEAHHRCPLGMSLRATIARGQQHSPLNLHPLAADRVTEWFSAIPAVATLGRLGDTRSSSNNSNNSRES
jgi:hypothetical protein